MFFLCPTAPLSLVPRTVELPKGHNHSSLFSVPTLSWKTKHNNIFTKIRHSTPRISPRYLALCRPLIRDRNFAKWASTEIWIMACSWKTARSLFLRIHWVTQINRHKWSTSRSLDQRLLSTSSLIRDRFLRSLPSYDESNATTFGVLVGDSVWLTPIRNTSGFTKIS